MCPLKSKIRVKSSFNLDDLITTYDFEYNDIIGKYFITKRHSDKALLVVNKWNREIYIGRMGDMKALELVYLLTKDGVLTDLTPEEEAELEEEEKPTEPEEPNPGNSDETPNI